MEIRCCTDSDIGQCIEILADTEIGKTYYPNKKIIKHLLENALKNDCFDVCVNQNNEVIGFVWYSLKGAFAFYPYLQIIAVSSSHRGEGTGRMLLEHYEQSALKLLKTFSTKSYLVTADFNDSAYDFYIRKGYRQIGTIASLYKKGVDERLMFKDIRRES